VRFRTPRAAALAIVTVLVVAVGVTAGVGASGGGPTSSPSAGAPDQLTPLTGRVIAAPHPVTTADGKVHLVYELELLNTLGAKVSVTRIDALDPARGNAVVGSLAGAELQSAIRLFAGVAGTTFPPATSGLLYMDVALSRRAPVPARLTHRISITLDPAPTGPLQPATTYAIAPTEVVRDAPIQVAPPLRGANWVDSGGCCPPTSYHRTTVLGINGALHDTQRFAIDFVRLNDQGRLFDGPADQNSSYAYFGEPIHAVADGVVVRLLDGQPNETPGGFPELPIGEIDGNYVVMDIGGGHFAFYAHFQPGLKVKLGQRVRQGQVLGLLGNSGNSDGPHLHFHVMDGPSPLGSNGLPYTFSRFRGQGAITNLDDLPGGAVATVDTSRLAGPFANVLPRDRQLVAFPNPGGPKG
jgi:hypothetical protein